jgi:hypothetical protein
LAEAQERLVAPKVAHPNDFKPVDDPNPTMQLARAAAASKKAVYQQAERPKKYQLDAED